MSRVSLAVTLPAPEYRALAKIADARGVSAHLLIEQLVSTALAPKPPQPLRRYRKTTPAERDVQFATVIKLHAKGKTDREMGDAMGVCTDVARKRRVALRLPPNGKPGRPRK